jgi:hypothetical protein
MVIETYKRHIPALLMIMVAVGSWIVLLPTLPDPIDASLTFTGERSLSTDPVILFIAMCAFMVVSHVVCVLLDLFRVAPVVPGYIMASIDWIVEGAAAIFYLSILGDAAGLLPSGAVGLVVGAAAMIVVLVILYRRATDAVGEAARLLSGARYVQRVRPSLMTRLLFFIRPLIPSIIVIDSGGIRIIGVLYDVTYPWERIERVREAGLWAFFSNRPLRLNDTFNNCVEIHLKDRKEYLVISPGDRGRFLEVSAGFLAGGTERAGGRAT